MTNPLRSVKSPALLPQKDEELTPSRLSEIFGVLNGNQIGQAQRALAMRNAAEEAIRLMQSGDIEGATSKMQYVAEGMEFLAENTVNAREVSEALRESTNMIGFVDPLTQINNRRYFMAEAGERIDEATKDSTYAVLLFDIDHFKSVNDTYGHAVGDDVLKIFAKTLQQGVQGRDIAARLGGEEFVVLLNDVTPDKALDVAERLRKAVDDRPDLPQRGGKPFIPHVSVSVGVAMNHPGEKLDAMLKRADKALYEAKDGGRNRVVAAKEETTTKALPKPQNTAQANTSRLAQ